MPELPACLPNVSGIVHLAAQAGVRHSLTDPYVYVQANVMGQVVHARAGAHLPEAPPFCLCEFFVRVWRQMTSCPFPSMTPSHSRIHSTPRRSAPDELIGHNLRPSLWCPFNRLAILHGIWPVGPTGHGRVHLHARDPDRPNRSASSTAARCGATFTYIDDIVSGVLRALDRPPAGAPPHALYNLGKPTVPRS